MRNRIFIAATLCITRLLPGSETAKDEPLPIGNFSVPTVSQIAPLVAFGQLLIGKQDFLPQLSGSYTRGHDSYENIIAPNAIYGIRDDLSAFLYVPFIPRSRSDSSHSSGIGDMLLQLEYGFYNKTRVDYTLLATVVGNVQFPTGSSSKDPPTGNGSYTYFAGTTFAFLSHNWYAFASPGVNLTTAHHRTRFGNTWLYQWGLARYIKALSPPGCIFDLMLEFDGTYTEKDRIDGTIDPDSGGNTIFITPSIWLSSKRWILQWGMGFPILQDLNGRQDKVRLFTAYTLGIAFQF